MNEQETYWRVQFSHDILCKQIIKQGENIQDIITDYLISQNRGESKSDRIAYKHKTRISKVQYDELHTPFRLKYD